jgi:hypothetical protein
MDQSAKAHLPADKSLVGVFTDYSAAERAYQHLKETGYTEDQISILMSDEARTQYFEAPHLHLHIVGDSIKEGPGLGGVIGAGTGGILGAMAGAAVSFALPGVGLVAAGPIAAMLAGGGFGALAGSVLGTLFGLSLSEEEAHSYEEKIRQGNILIGINPHSEEDARNIRQEWQNLGAEAVTQQTTASVSASGGIT